MFNAELPATKRAHLSWPQDVQDYLSQGQTALRVNCPTSPRLRLSVPMNKRYGISDINHFGMLKLGFPLLMMFAFLTRHWWLAVGIMMSRSPEVMAEFFDGSITYLLIAESPALLACVLAMKRKPDAGKLVRFLWKQGFWLILLSLVLNLVAIALVPGKHVFSLSRLEGLQWAAVAVNICILGYILFFPRTRDTFAEFPTPPEAPKP